MKISISLLVFTLGVGVSLAEPPVGGGYSTTIQDAFAPPPVSGPSSSYGVPSSSYGPPSSGRRYQPQVAPSTAYGAPSRRFGGHRQTTAIIRPSTNYGVPGIGSNIGVGGSFNGYDDGSSGPASYKFSYHVQDAASGNDFGHQESREGHQATGMYMVLLPDGRRQIVEYTADESGYHPIVRYEGTAITGGHTGGSTTTGGGGYRY